LTCPALDLDLRLTPEGDIRLTHLRSFAHLQSNVESRAAYPRLNHRRSDALLAQRWHELGPPPLGARDSRVVAMPEL
jgi:hypothetical protein